MKKNNKYIQKINSFEDVNILKIIDKNTLVVFDIDSVLIIPKEPRLHPLIFKKYLFVVDNLYNTLSREKRHFLNHSIIAHEPILIEKKIPDIIKKIKKQTQYVIALTAAKKGRFDNSRKFFHNVRFNQLKSLDICFSNKIIKDDDYNFLKDTYGDYPGLRNGILYSACLNNKKGEVLSAFLYKIKIIKKIIIFDDKLKHINSILEITNKNYPDINIFSFHYNGVESMKCPKNITQEDFANYISKLIQKIDFDRLLQ
ncbi:MAG: hypothetical protein A3F40_04345 [Chlamydiae bacterium RIFCSPHIGHO2_12_FULL_27_8]|nr:MAG: hypothetical protein A3F40_04345 [Chlamydiae bacterium RIFCSPHIGHO2_12_FULL_27_8]